MGKKEKLCANPLMAYKKQLKKKEIKKSKKQQVERVEARTLLRDPTKLGEEIEKLEAEAATNRADLELRRKLQALRAHQAVLEKKHRNDEKRPPADLGYAGAPSPYAPPPRPPSQQQPRGGGA